MFRAVFIFSLSVLLGSGNEILRECECPDVEWPLDSCSLEADTVVRLQKGAEILNNSQKMLSLNLKEIRSNLKDQTKIVNYLLKKRGSEWLPKDASASIKNLGRTSETAYHSCSEAFSYGKNKSGFYEITLPQFTMDVFKVWCTMESRYGGGWSRILHRKDNSVAFNRTWQAYKDGFGEGENFFIGLNKLHAMTTESPQNLLVILHDWTSTKYAQYMFFAIGDETEKYALKVLGKFSGDTGDSLKDQQGTKFSTFDKINEKLRNDRKKDCTEIIDGGWWYKNCYKSNLNGHYYGRGESVRPGTGIFWETLTTRKTSLKGAEMLIRKASNAGCFVPEDNEKFSP